MWQYSGLGRSEVATGRSLEVENKWEEVSGGEFRPWGGDLVLKDRLWAGVGRGESQTSGFKVKGSSMHDR